jgi:cytochrome c biogenesis protein CcdA
LLGILVFTSQLSRIASVPFLADLLARVSGESIQFDRLGIGMAFIAGLASFLSPCILPIVPGFLSYLATTATTEAENENRKNKK